MNNIQTNRFSNIYTMSKNKVKTNIPYLIEGQIFNNNSNITKIDIKQKLNLKIFYKEIKQYINKDLNLDTTLPFYIDKKTQISNNPKNSLQKAHSKIKANLLWHYLKLKKKEQPNKNQYISGRIIDEIKGGYTVGIAGFKAFLPNSHIRKKKGHQNTKNKNKNFSKKKNIPTTNLLINTPRKLKINKLRLFKILKTNNVKRNMIVSPKFKKNIKKSVTKKN